MSLFSFLGSFGKKVREFKAEWITVGAKADVTEANLLQANKEWVFIATDKNANAVAAVRYKVMRYQASGDDAEVFSGPLYEFLENPGQNFTGKDFIYLNTASKELTGNAFWERDGKKLRPLISTLVFPVIDKGKLAGYRYTEGGQQRLLLPENVLHDRYIDPARPYWGVGKLQKIARWVDVSSYATEFLKKFFVNGATFGGFIESEVDSMERLKLMQAALANDHTGVDKAHKWGVLPKGSKATANNQNMSEIEMGATDDRYRDKILAGFGVPKNILGLTQGENRATIEGTEYAYAKYTVQPIVRDLIEFLNTNIAPLLDPSGRTYFACDEFIPVNMEIVLKEREIALGRQQYKTVNEVRAETGLPPVKGGDVIYGNPFLMPLGTPTPSPDPLPDEDEEEEEIEPRKALPASMRREVRTDNLISSLSKRVKKVLDTQEVKDASAHKGFIKRLDAHEKLITTAIVNFNSRQQRELQLNLTSIVKAVSKSDLFDMEGEIAIMIDAVSPLLKGLMLEQAVQDYIEQGFPGSFDPTKSTVTRAIELAAKRLAKSYNNTTANLIKSALNDGIAAGDDQSQLAARIATVYEHADTVRALMVARSEGVYIANEGSREAYRQSGIVKTIRWYTADSEACEFCSPMNGKVIGIEEVFFKKGDIVQGSDGGTIKADYRTIDVPPLHTNCRCLIRAEEIEIN